MASIKFIAMNSAAC